MSELISGGLLAFIPKGELAALISIHCKHTATCQNGHSLRRPARAFRCAPPRSQPSSSGITRQRSLRTTEPLRGSRLGGRSSTFTSLCARAGRALWGRRGQPRRNGWGPILGSGNGEIDRVEPGESCWGDLLQFGPRAERVRGEVCLVESRLPRRTLWEALLCGGAQEPTGVERALWERALSEP